IKLKTGKTDDKVDGYEVISATSKKKLAKVKKAKSFTKTTIKLTKLKKGKTYYIKVRAYKFDGEEKVYGKWSRVKKIKIKK
nr:calcineurin-like phosphoesterase [Lachnospiraceae bacterium]